MYHVAGLPLFQRCANLDVTPRCRCLRPAGSCRTARGSPVRRGATSTRAPRPAGSSELESGDRVEVWEGLAAEAAAVLAEGPGGEDVSVVCVRDHAVVVAH